MSLLYENKAPKNVQVETGNRRACPFSLDLLAPQGFHENDLAILRHDMN